MSEILTDFASFQQKIKSEILPSGFASVSGKDCQAFYYFKYSDIGNYQDAPKLLTVIVTSNLDDHAYVYSTLIPPSSYHHITSSSKLKAISELLAFCKSFCEKSSENQNQSNFIALVVSLLESAIFSEAHLVENPDSFSLIQFVIEQLKLIDVPKQGRRYTANMVKTAFLWQLSSTALYKKLRKTLILPSINHLLKLSAVINVESGSLDLHYLQQKTNILTEMEKKVLLIIDEVYTAQRAEYSNGSFIGLTENGTPAKTVLIFMVQSIAGKYKVVVCLVPVNKLETSLLHSWFEKVMRSMNNFLHVIAVCTDNHVCNR